MTHRSSMLASTIRQIVARHAIMIPPDVSTVVSITEVALNADGSIATVFLNAVSHPEKALKWLKDHKGEIKKDLGSTLQSYGAPQLRFAIDEHTQRVSRLDDLLQDKKP